MAIDGIRKIVLKSKEMTEFQRRVYLELLNIPEGEIISYRELARRIGSRSTQAVGQAIHRNPFAPEIPCYRVIKSNGTLGGYAYVADRKAELLRSEQSLEAPDRIPK